MNESSKEFRARIRAQRQEMNKVQAASDISDGKDLLIGIFWCGVVLLALFILFSVFDK